MESYYLGCNVNQYCIFFGSTDYSGASESFFFSFKPPCLSIQDSCFNIFHHHPPDHS